MLAGICEKIKQFCMSANSYSLCEKQGRYSVAALAIAALFFLQPPYGLASADSELLDKVLWVGSLIMILLSLATYLYYIRYDIFGILVLLFGLSLLLADLLNGGSLLGFVRGWMPSIAMALYVRAAIRKNRRSLLWAVLVYSSFCSLVNLAILIVAPVPMPILRPGSFYTLFGYKNFYWLWGMTAFFSSAFLDYEKGAILSARTISLHVAYCVQVVMSGSATGLLIALFVTIGFVCIQFSGIRRHLNLLVYTAAYMLSFGAIVLWRLPERFSGLTEALLHKSADFTGRTDIWDIAINQIFSPGGLMGSYDALTSPLLVGGTTYWAAHNAVLDIALWGGIGAFAAAAGLLVITVCKLYRHRRQYVSALLSLVVGAFLVQGISEAIVCPIFCMWAAIAYGWYLDRRSWLPEDMQQRDARIMKPNVTERERFMG